MDFFEEIEQKFENDPNYELTSYDYYGRDKALNISPNEALKNAMTKMFDNNFHKNNERYKILSNSSYEEFYHKCTYEELVFLGW